MCIPLFLARPIHSCSLLHSLAVVQGPTIRYSQNWRQRANSIPGCSHVDVFFPVILLLSQVCVVQLDNLPVVTTVVFQCSTSYFCILAAGAASKGSLYWLPGSHILRSAASAIASATLSIAFAFGHAARHSETVSMFQVTVGYHWTSQPRNRVIFFLKGVLYKMPSLLATDVFHLRQAIAQQLVAFGHQVNNKLFSVPTPAHRLDQKRILGLTYVLAVLQSPLNNTAHLLALEFLATLMVLDDFDPTIVTECFNVLIVIAHDFHTCFSPFILFSYLIFSNIQPSRSFSFSFISPFSHKRQ